MQRRREHRYQVWESVALTVLSGGDRPRAGAPLAGPGDSPIPVEPGSVVAPANGKAQACAATVVDISRSGYRILSGLNLGAGTEVLITLHSVAIFGTVRHSEPAEDGVFTIGVEITNVVSEPQPLVFVRAGETVIRA